MRNLLLGLVALVLFAVAFTVGPDAATLTALAASPIAFAVTRRDGDITRDEVINLDADADNFPGELQRVIALRVEAGVGPVQASLSAAQAENAALRALVVGDIIRLRRITGEADVEKETRYLVGLPMERLQMEWERTDRAATPEKPVTGSDAPPDEPVATEWDAASPVAQ